MRTTAFLWCLLLAAASVEGDGLATGTTERIESRWATVDGVRVRYRELGGPATPLEVPLLLVHGWMGSSYDYYALMERLPPSIHVIAPDLPGSGLSQKSGIDFNVDYFLGFLERFVETLHLQRVVLVGHSMGGGLVVNFAARYPHRVERLVLIDPDGLAGEEGFLGLVRQMDFIVDLGTRLNNRLAIELATKLNVFEDPAKATKEFVDSIAETCLSPEGRRAQAQITKRVLGNAPVDALLPTLSVPTLIIWGEEDKVLHPRWARKFAQGVPGSELVMIPDTGHMPQIEAPELVWSHISQFIGFPSPGG